MKFPLALLFSEKGLDTFFSYKKYFVSPPNTLFNETFDEPVLLQKTCQLTRCANKASSLRLPGPFSLERLLMVGRCVGRTPVHSPAHTISSVISHFCQEFPNFALEQLQLLNRCVSKHLCKLNFTSFWNEVFITKNKCKFFKKQRTAVGRQEVSGKYL